MNCQSCNEITGYGCEQSLCNGTVSLPCDFVIPAACVKNVTALPNLGACNEVVGNYACTDLQTVLLAIDAQLETCGEGDGLWTRNIEEELLYPTTLTDNVGIGTDTPETSLHLVGNYLQEDEDGTSIVYVSSSAADDEIVFETLESTTELSTALRLKISTGEITLNSSDNLNTTASQIKLNPDGDIYLNQGVTNGKIGIGTASPDYKLDVSGDFISENIPAVNQTSFILNGEKAFTLPYSGASTIEGAVAGYQTATTSSLLAIVSSVAQLSHETSSLISAVSVSSAVGATLNCTTGTNIKAELQATNTSTVYLNSQTASDSTVLELTPTTLEIDGNVGFSGTFLAQGGDTVTVVKGIIISVAP